MEDSDIIRNISLGNKESFRELVSRYKDRIFLICLKFTDSKEDAEDLTQEIFIRIY